MHEIGDQARGLLLNPKMSTVRHVGVESLRHVDQIVRRRPEARALADFALRFSSIVTEPDAGRLQGLLERRFLRPDSDATLFELQVGLGLLAELEALGSGCHRPRFCPPPASRSRCWSMPMAVNSRSGGRRPCGTHLGFPQSGRWRLVLDDNGLTPYPLRPDFVVVNPLAPSA